MRKYFCLIAFITLFISCDQDTEYLGHYVTCATYDEPWDEYIHKTCTKTVHDGYDKNGNEITHEEEYDCSYVEYHEKKWFITLENGHKTYISEDQYKQVVKKLGTPRVFVDMHRHYHRIDGDRYEVHFNNKWENAWTITQKNTYKNKIINSKSVFNFSDVSKEEFKEYGLYDYPSNFNYFIDQNPIIGYTVNSNVIDSFQCLNAFYGPKYQFRCYVMVWRNAPLKTSKLEQDFLVGGNKNELIICVSINNKNQVQWVNSFSWEDKPYIEVAINHLYEPEENFDILKIYKYLKKEVPTKWHRKEFKDFEYIKTQIK